MFFPLPIHLTKFVRCPAINHGLDTKTSAREDVRIFIAALFAPADDERCAHSAGDFVLSVCCAQFIRRCVRTRLLTDSHYARTSLSRNEEEEEGASLG